MIDNFFGITSVEYVYETVHWKVESRLTQVSNFCYDVGYMHNHGHLDVSLPALQSRLVAYLKKNCGCIKIHLMNFFSKLICC